MIRGSKNYNNKDCWYIQTNNPTEQSFKKIGLSSWLETCGPTAAVNCLAAVGADLNITCPGSYKPQPEEVLTDWFNNPVNYTVLKNIRDNVNPDEYMGNRVPQYYPEAIEQVFGASANFIWGKMRDTIDYLNLECAVQVQLIKPAHYIAIVAYDNSVDEFIYNDSWPNRKGLQNNGFNERMTISEYKSNVHDFIIYYDKVRKQNNGLTHFIDALTNLFKGVST